MREIIMKTISAGPDGVFHPGTRRMLPKREAAAMVKGGHAEYATVEPEEKEVEVPKEVETVNSEETATEPVIIKRGRSKK